MRRSTVRVGALAAVAALAVLAWPGPAGADTSLGGYSGAAQALPLRVQIYEPVIPIPSSPQIDGGVGLTRTTTDTGPVSRALASYLWPGDTVGDGFGALVGNDNAKYPVQVNSRYPATTDAPARNTAQLTDGNGMTTASTTSTTTATVTGLGVAGPGVDLTGGLLTGLGQLAGQPPSTTTSGGTALPVGPLLAGLGTVEGLRSTSSITVGSASVTSKARAQAGTVSLLGGLVALGGVDVSSTTTSTGTRATATGSVSLGSLAVAGVKASFGDHGLVLGPTATALPKLPSTITSLLSELGIEITPVVTTRKVDGATSSLAATGLRVSIDTAAIKQRLGVGAVLGTLGSLLSSIPQLGDQLQPLLGLGPKIVVEIGDVATSVTAAPAYSGGAAPVVGAAPSAAPAAGVTGGGSASVGGNGTFGSAGGPALPAATGGTGPAATAPVATGYDLPGLGAVPKTLVLAGLLVALVLAWALRSAGSLLFGAARGCDAGLVSGVPDLRGDL